MSTAIITDDVFLEHDTGAGHPERPGRLLAVEQRLSEGGLKGALVRLEATREARDEEIGWVHDPAYVQGIRAAIPSSPVALDQGDTVVSPGSLQALLRATGAGLELADRIVAGEIDNGFALVRPPGHHAEHAHAMGFCVVNNIAVLARYLQKQHRLRKIAVVDFDVHHGNGTQNAFYTDPEVLFVSLHQFPHYPGTGRFDERGRGAGLGATLNVPMAAGDGPDEYRRAFEAQVLPAVRTFAPEVLLISAGFDAHRDDPLSATQLDSATYGWMTHELCSLVRDLGHGRIVSLLEGGYHLAALAESAEYHLQALLDAPGST